MEERILKSSELRTAFLECDVKVAVAEPPFEDLEGNGCHFEKQGKQKLSGRKLANATRVDLLTSLATLLREVARHGPSVVVGTGVLLARNVHISEAQKIANAWSKIKLLVGVNPRISKAKPGRQLLQEACPEWFSPHPLECLPRLGLVERYAPAKEEIEELLSSTGVIKIGSLGEVIWHAWLERDSKEIWEHEGLCACGRQRRLFGQCMQCIAAEHAENVQARADQEAADQGNPCGKQIQAGRG